MEVDIMIKHFSNNTRNSLGFYVYVYSDPDTHKPFYVGKGNNDRVFDHLDDPKENDKINKINFLKENGKEPIIEILAHGLDNDTALKVEAAAIDLIGIENLTNIKRGHGSSTYGKIEVSKLEARYSEKKLDFKDITENIMFIRINQLYRNDMSDLELYDATRGYWKVNPENAKKMDYALAIYEGMVLEVYEIVAWFPALSTFTSRKNLDAEHLKNRYEFVGRIADENIRKQYVDKSVENFYSKGDASPFKYIWGKKQK